ncbi:MAG: hypothetical protein WC821_00495 [archaeon]|jgi:hypothetical protein
MLGFILSKMQMLFFAVAISVVALLFYSFVSNIGLSESANNLLLSNSRVISDQLNNDLLCSDKFAVLPDVLTKGFAADPFFYDLEFSKQTFGSEPNITNTLILRIVEHKRSNQQKENVIAAKSISTEGEFVLVDAKFIVEDSRVDSSYNDGKNTFISLYPRAASKTAVQASAPDAFVALKEIVGGKKTIYIIPCSTEKEPNNCIRNILRVGCYKLSKKTNLLDSDLIPSCFNKSTSVSDTIDVTRNYTWGDCKNLFGLTS